MTGSLYDIFLSHSHKDQKEAYGLGRWLTQLWPGVQIFNTSRELAEIDRLLPGYYLTKISQSNCMLLLASASSLASPHVRREIQIAREGDVPILCAKSRRDPPGDDPVLTDIGPPASDLRDTREWNTRDLAASIAQAISRPVPDSDPGPLLEWCMLNAPAEGSFTNVPEDYLPNVAAIESGNPTRDDVLKWLSIVEKWMDTRARTAGIHVGMLPARDTVYQRLYYVFMGSDPADFPKQVRQFRAIIDEDFLMYLFQMLQVAQKMAPELAPRISQLIISVVTSIG